MTRQLIIICILLLAGGIASAQQKKPKQQLIEKEITIGMLVKIPACKKDQQALESMDLYRKTRIPPNEIEIDSATGDGIFENFFGPGDFDARRLPCEYAGKQYKVAALRVFDDEKTGAEKRVMILYTNDALSMIWVEFDKAVALKEIIF
jgi:hypothetical protein